MSAPADRPQRPLLRLFPVLLLNLIAFGIAIPILPALCEAQGGQGLEVGALFALQALGQFLMAPRWGALSDRLGRKPVLLLTLLGAVVMDLGTSMATGLPLLFAIRFGSGLMSGNIATASALIADATQPEERSKGMALIGISFGLGFTIGPGLGALVSHLAPDGPGMFGQGLPFVVSAGINVLAALLGGWILREASVRSEARAAAREAARGLRVDWRALLAIPGVKAMVGFFAGYSMTVTIMETTLYLYMSAQYGYDERQVGLIFAGMGLFAASIQGGVGRISKRIGDRAMTGLGALMLGVGLLVATAYEALGFLLVFLALAAAGRALAQPGGMALMSGKARHEREAGALMGMMQSANSAGRILGPLCGGLLYDQIAPRAPFVAAGLIMTLGALLWWRVTLGAQPAVE